MTIAADGKNRLLLKAQNRILRELEGELAVVDLWPEDALATGIARRSDLRHLASFAIDNWESRPKNMVRDVRFSLSLETAEDAPDEGSTRRPADHEGLTYADLFGLVARHLAGRSPWGTSDADE